MKHFKYILFILIFLLIGCEQRDNTKLHKVHWDRDMCELCKMVVSQRHYAVQVVNLTNGRSYMFDDIGCTIVWFKEEKISWEKEAKIYIADTKTGKFIDARKAYYDLGKQTPMDYGFSAYLKKDDIENQKYILNFDEVRLKILRGETMQNQLIKQQVQNR
jgi:nitrous oxide reductase accessory protein NosL